MDFLLHCTFFLNVLAVKKFEMGVDDVVSNQPNTDYLTIFNDIEEKDALLEDPKVIKRLEDFKNLYENSNNATEEEIDDVQNQKCGLICQNGGRCLIEKKKIYTCLCSAGFTGKFCEHDVNECEHSETKYCGAHQECINTIGSFRCQCYEGYMMQENRICIAVSDCLQHPCLHGGKCIKSKDELNVCVCALGFKGDLCEIEMEGCNNNPCPSSFICVAMQTTNFICILPSGDEGTHRLSLPDIKVVLLWVIFISITQTVCIFGGFKLYRNFKTLHWHKKEYKIHSERYV